MSSLGFLNMTSRLAGVLTWSLLRVPMTFFYSTPVGEVFKLYLRDLDVVDGSLPRWVL